MLIDTEELPRLALAEIDGFESKAERARFLQLHGLTNQVYKVEVDGETFVLRIPDPRAADLIDRRAEAANACAAAGIGLAPEILHCGTDGLLLMRFVSGQTMSPEAFRQNPGAIERTAEAFARLHRSGLAFTRDFRLFETLELYLKVIDRNAPAGTFELLPAIAGIRAAFEDAAVPPAPCHCDPTGPNLIDTGQRMVLIDWEFSAMNYPAFDLAYLSVEGEFDEEQDARLLRYYQERAGRAVGARFVLHKALVDYLAALWELILASRGGRPAAQAEHRLARCRATIGRADFGECLATVRHSG